MTDDATLRKAIEQAVPNSLDDIIREHRDKLKLRMATKDDLAEFPPMVAMLDGQKQVKATVNDWRIVCLDQGDIGKGFMLTGIDARTGNVWATSLVKSVDLENHLLLTENSLYRLGNKGKGEPTFHELLHLCHMFHSWGWGAKYGVPFIFY